MRVSLSTTAGTVLLITFVFFATAATGATLLTQVVRVTETSVSNATSIKVQEAFCPAGLNVIAGVTDVNSIDPVGDVLTISESRPSDPPAQGWLGVGYATAAASGDWFLQTTVICADIPVQVVTAQTAENSSNLKIATADCPAGTKVLGGGVRIRDIFLPTNLTISGTEPTSGNAWRGRAHELNPISLTWSLRVDAICADIANPIQYLSNFVFLRGSRVQEHVNCPLDWDAIGGGVTLTGSEDRAIALQQISLTPSVAGAIFRTLTPISGSWGLAGRGICISFPVFANGFESN